MSSFAHCKGPNPLQNLKALTETHCSYLFCTGSNLIVLNYFKLMLSDYEFSYIYLKAITFKPEGNSSQTCPTAAMNV